MAVADVQVSASSGSQTRWDLVKGVTEWRLWAFMGLQDIRQRYRRSLLGPIWLAFGLGATVLGIGVLYSQILKTPVGNYIPYISISLLVWTFIAQVITESTALFQNAGSVITSVKVPYTSFVLRAIMRNMIVSAHSLIVVVIAFVLFKFPVTFSALVALPGLCLLCANLYWIALLVGLISARYRDIAQIVNYSIAIALFLTPVIWLPSSVRPGSPFIQFNPLAQLLQVVRGPIFDHRIPVYSFAYCAVMLIVGFTVTIFTFSRARRHLVYWI